MRHLKVTARIAAPIERVFAAVSDHETFIHDAMTRTQVIVPGQGDRNGLGAQREVRAKPFIRFVEEITSWEPPYRFGYRIRESSLPIRHHGGELVFSFVDGATDIDWQTRFEMPIPLLGGPLALPIGAILTRSFHGLLSRAKRRLEG